jgi:hypothetical protein
LRQKVNPVLTNTTLNSKRRRSLATHLEKIPSLDRPGLADFLRGTRLGPAQGLLATLGA